MEKKPWFVWGSPLLDAGFLVVPNGLFAYQAEMDLSAPEINLILQAASYYRSNKNIIPSTETLARNMGVTSRQVRRIKDSLVTKGFLTVTPRYIEGRRTSNEWNFVGLVKKLGTIMSQHPDINVTPGTDKIVSPVPEENVSEATSKEHTIKEHTKVPKRSANSLIAELQSYFNYPDGLKVDPVPNHGKEAKAIKKMLDRGFKWDDIFSLWQEKVAKRNGDYVSMVYVNEDIGKGDHGKARKVASENDAERLATSVGQALD